MNQITHGSADGQGPRRTGHEETWDLLPWYVNGSLEGSERREVEEHLDACGICREELRYWRGFAELAREDGDLTVSPADGLERLRRRAATAVSPAAARGRAATVRWLAPWQRTPAPVRWLLAAQLAGLLLLGGLLAASGGAPAGAPATASPAAFHTLSDPAPATAGAPGAPLLRVVFSDQTREREMRGALISVGGRIVAGPSPTGVYTVAVGADDDVSRVLETLRSFQQVLFAEAAAGSADGP
jgi:hypothetical protein